MAQTGYTPILIYGSSTAAATPTAGNLTTGASGVELALNYTDGKLYFKNNSGVVTLLASSAGASGDVVGPASATDNAVARFDLTTGKLIQNSVVIIGDTGDVTGVGALSASGNVTLSGGTANGVAYLNGSKVLTTGSALTFDGTNISTALGGSYYSANANYGFGTPDSAGLQIFAASGDSIRFGSRSAGTFSEQMRLTSTGLGIGTSSPSAKLDIYQSSARYVRAYPSSGLADLEVVTNNNVQPVFAVKGTGTADLIRAYAGATQALTLDSSGNLGLGVTPSAWGSGWVAEQLAGGGAAIASRSTNPEVYLTANAHYNGSNWIYKTSNPASYYAQDGSEHKWYRASSGTAGNAITFTQAMTLDASRNLLVGTTTSPSGSGKISTTGGIVTRVNAQTTTTSPWAWNSDSFDQQSFSALANALTINADAGTPADGQKTVFRFKDNGTARALTWTTGASKAFRAIGVTLPTTTVINKTLYVGCIYNGADARWDAVAVAQEA